MRNKWKWTEAQNIAAWLGSKSWNFEKPSIASPRSLLLKRMNQLQPGPASSSRTPRVDQRTHSENLRHSPCCTTTKKKSRSEWLVAAILLTGIGTPNSQVVRISPYMSIHVLPLCSSLMRSDFTQQDLTKFENSCPCDSQLPACHKHRVLF